MSEEAYYESIVKNLSAMAHNSDVGKQLEKLGKFSIVLMPTPVSEEGDIVMENITVSNLLLQILGGLDASRIFMITKNAMQAKQAGFLLLEGRDKAEEVRNRTKR